MFTLFSLILMGVGVALALRGSKAHAEAQRSRSWPWVGGRVVASGVEIRELQDDDHLGTVRKYRPAVTYAFQLDGVERRGTEIAIGVSNLYSEWAEAEKRARRYPVDKKVRVYRDPRGTTTVLEPGNTRSADTMLAMGLGIVLTGTVLLVIGLSVR